MARLGPVAVAHPPPVEQSELWRGYFRRHTGGQPVAARIWDACGVERRHAVTDPLTEDLSGWSTEARMRRYAAEAPELGRRAGRAALAAAGLCPSQVGMFAVVSCTGYHTPGLDILLAEQLGMAAGVRRLLIGHMGCYAALPGLAAVADFVLAQRRPALLLCVELSSLHVQPPDDDLDQVVAHALFSDAAAAVAVLPGGDGEALADIRVHTVPGTADLMSWQVTDRGFRMGLSPRVPEALAGPTAELVADLLAGHGRSAGEVAGWALHPGGPRILRVVGERLGLGAAAVEPAATVLREHGNCSSATVLMTLAEVRRSTGGAGDVVLLAFGPGLTVYAGLLLADSKPVSTATVSGPTRSTT